MARYTVSQRSYIHNKLMEAGDEFEYEDAPGPHMVPLDPAAKKAMAAAKGSHRPGPDHPDYVLNLVNANLGQGEKAGGSDVMHGQQAPLGIVVDQNGQVRGVTAGVGTGDPGDGSQANEDGAGPGLPNVDKPSAVKKD